MTTPAPLPPLTVSALVEEAHRNAVAKGFWRNAVVYTASTRRISLPADTDTALCKLCLIHTEVSEAAEVVRCWGKHVPDGTTSTRQIGLSDLSAELADIVIRVADLAGALGLNLEDTLTRKMAYNRERIYMHGKRA